MKLPPEESALRYKLYNQGLSDQEIADRCGVGHGVISSWRNRHHLECHWVRMPAALGSKSGMEWGSVPMEDALTPDQCNTVKGFLRALVCMANQRPGKPVDVGGFMAEYRRGGAAYEQVQR